MAIKRLGAHIMLLFLSLNHIELEYTQDELSSIFLKVASGGFSCKDLFHWDLFHQKGNSYIQGNTAAFMVHEKDLKIKYRWHIQHRFTLIFCPPGKFCPLIWSRWSMSGYGNGFPAGNSHLHKIRRQPQKAAADFAFSMLHQFDWSCKIKKSSPCNCLWMNIFSR